MCKKNYSPMRKLLNVKIHFRFAKNVKFIKIKNIYQIFIVIVPDEFKIDNKVLRLTYFSFSKNSKH